MKTARDVESIESKSPSGYFPHFLNKALAVFALPLAVASGCLLAGCAVPGQPEGAGREAGIGIVAAGQAQAEIIIPDQPLPVEIYAADELHYHIQKATGVTLVILPESQSATNGKHIYLGACTKTRAAGIDTSTLEANARIIRTIGSDLFIAGRDSDGDVLKRLHANYTRCGTLFGVYDFLEKEMGVRWLWPGELGEYIPETQKICTRKWNETVLPKLKHSRLRSRGQAGWPNPQVGNRYDRQLLPQWKRRQRFSQAISLEYGHAFGHYWERFGKTNPEFFALKPNGKREPSGAPGVVQMCVSNEGFQEQSIRDWRAKAENYRGKKWDADKQGPLMLNGCENDKRAIDPSCTCDACQAWDAANAEILTKYSADLIGSEKSSQLRVKRHSLSDRYAKFWLALQEKGRQHEPHAKVLGLAYSDYFLPPLETTLNKDILVGVTFPTDALFPFDKNQMDKRIKVWDGWNKAGVSLFFRPNSLLSAGDMPIYYADDLAALFSHCYKNGMIATDFDSLTGQWAVQGPNLYLAARIHEHPDWSAKKILDEYYGGFGAAKPAVRDYFQHWKKVSKTVTVDQVQGYLAETGTHKWREVYVYGARIFTPEILQEGVRILARAEKLAAGDPMALQRVDFLQKGLKQVQLILATEAAFVRYKKNGEVNQFSAALDKLDSFRRSIGKELITDLGYNVWFEKRWGRELVNMLGKGGEDLPDTWKLMWDPDKKGETNHWQSEAFDDTKWFNVGVDAVWEKQPVGEAWAAAHGGVGYNGLAWYRNAFRTEPGKRYALIFGAVDEACVVWLNGEKLLTRPYPYQGEKESWMMPFEIDITEHIHFDRLNILAVRVEDKSGAGGIWKGVKLITAEAVVDASLNLLKNSGFESGQKPWSKSSMAGTWSFSIDDTVSHSGGRSARLECTQVAPHNPNRPRKPNSMARWYQHIPVEKDKSYRFRCFVKTEPKFTGKIQIFFTGDANGTGTATVTFITTQGLWRELKIDNYVAAADTAGIFLNQYGLGNVWFDDIEVIGVR